MAFLPTARSVTRVTQAAHGFVAGDVLYNNNGTWAKAQADALATAVPVGVVESVTTNDFALITAGEIKLTGLSAATAYYLSPTVAGAFTATKPTTTGHFVVPVLRTGTATQAYVNIETPEPAAVDGTVTSVAISGNNGIGVAGSPITGSGTITLSLGAITPSTVNGNTITTGTGTLTLATFTLTVAGTASISGTNTGDQTISLSGDASGSGTGAITVTLATVNSNVGTFGTASKTATVTVNGKGLVTAASEQDILIVGSTQLSDYGDPSGVATLDAGGKIPTAQLPDSVFGQLQYQGLWNASTNTPTLANTDTNKPGYYYVVSVAGTVDFGAGNIEFAVGDWVINNATLAGAATASLWSKVDNTDAVMSVFGRLGNVTAQNGDYTASQVTNVPAGDIAAVTVQAAINELDTEKQAGPLTGDVTTASASNPATTIAANAVTFAKFQQITPGKLLGRSGPGTGNVEEISLDSTLTLTAGTLSVTPSLTLSNLILTQGTITTDVPNLSGTVTWNNGAILFTGWKLNVTDTASDVESKLIDLQVGGSGKFQVRKDGAITTGTDRAAALNGAYLQHNSSDTNTQIHLVSMVHSTSATPVALFGGILRFRFTTTDTTVQTAASFVAFWTDPTTATRTSSIQVQTINNAAGSLCGTFTQGQLQFRAGSAALPSISYDGNPDCGLYFPTVNSIGVSINATLLATWDAAAYTLTGPRLVITHGTITSNLPGVDQTVTWNNAGVTFEAWKLSVTATAAASASRYISILKDGNDFALLDNLARWHVFRQTADTSGGSMTLFKRGTTGDATAAIAADTTMGLFSARGWNGSAYHSDGTGMQVLSDELFTGTNGGTRIEFRVVPQGSASNGAYVKIQSGAVTLQSGCRLVITRGTLTANAPSISITETWNSGATTFNGILLNITNTASAGASLIFDYQVDGVSKFAQDTTGRMYIQRQAADNAPLIVEIRKRGNGSGATNAPASGDNVGRLDFRGWDGTSAYVGGATIQMQAAENWSSTASGGRLFLAATPTGTISSVTYASLSNVTSDPIFTLINACRFIITRGTITTNLPGISETVTWNAGGVAFAAWRLQVTNTASASNSTLLDMQVDTITRFSVNRLGNISLLRQEADTSGSTLTLNKRGTTGDATAAVANGDTISGLDNGAWDGTTTSTVAFIRLFALETFTNTAHGCRYLIGVPTIGTTTVTTRVDLRATALSLVNGCSFVCTLGTITALQPVFDSTVTWNNAAVTFTGIQLNVTNTASNANSKFMEFLISGSGRAAFYNTGQITTALGTITSNTNGSNFTGTATWNAGGVTFTGIQLAITNTASATSSALLSFTVGGNSKLSSGVNGGLGVNQGFSTTVTLGVTNHGGSTTCARFTHSGATNIVEVQTTSADIAQVSLSANSTAGWNLLGLGTAQEFHLQQQGTGTRFSIETNGNVRIGTTAAAPASSVLNLWIAGGTAPSADPSTGFVQWSGSSEWLYRTAASNEGTGQTNRVHNRAAQVTGAGTDYSLTNTTARVDFGTTDPEIVLPTSGTYLVIACVAFIGDAAGAGDSLRAKLRNSTDSTDVGAEKPVTMNTNSGREIIILDEIVSINASKTIQVFAHNATSARGTVESTTTTIKYVRLY